MATEHAPTGNEYITHHLQNLTVQVGDTPFWSLNLDTLIVSGVVGILVFGLMWIAARNATAKTPGKLQAFIEIIVDMVDGQVKDAFHAKSSLITPLALTIFVWVFTMNCLDFIPVDFIPGIVESFGVPHWKSVPTSDPNATFAMSITVFLLCMVFNFKYKGIGGFAHELISAPFGIKMAPLNVLNRVIEEISRVLSLSLRLFGNMFAGEIIFILLVLLAGAWHVDSIGTAATSGLAMFGHIIMSLGWAIFHILIVTLQAFLFMMLTIVYLAGASEAH